MKILKQLIILFFFMVVGEVLAFYINLPIPSTIYALLLLIIALRYYPLDLDETSEFLTQHLSIFFIPPTVGLLLAWNELSKIIVPVIIIIVVSTAIVMVATGKVVQSQQEKRHD